MRNIEHPGFFTLRNPGRGFIFLTLAFLVYSGCKPVQPDRDYESYLNYGLQKGFPGIILAVHDIKGNRTWIGAKGYSDIQGRIKMTPDEHFPVGSVTKLVTAIAVFKLIEEGKLQLDTKVTGVLQDSIVTAIPHINDIDVRNLLEHTSGIYGTNNDMAYIGSILGPGSQPYTKWPPEELLRLSDSSRVAPFGIPDTGAYYSDANYILLELIVRQVSGKPLRDYVREVLFRPLKLHNTGYFAIPGHSETGGIPVTTQGYILNSEVIRSIIKISDRFPRVNDSLINTTTGPDLIEGASSVVSTAEDLILLGKTVFEGSLLSEGDMHLLWAPGVALEMDPSANVKQGILQAFKGKDGVIYAATGDGTSGFHCILAYAPSTKYIIVVYTNIFGLNDELDTLLEIVEGITSVPPEHS